jgi:hypothetical protein
VYVIRYIEAYQLIEVKLFVGNIPVGITVEVIEDVTVFT